MDNEIDISTSKLCKCPNNEIYYPNINYYTSLPLPIEWMEIFSDSYLQEMNKLEMLTYIPDPSIEKFISYNTHKLRIKQRKRNYDKSNMRVRTPAEDKLSTIKTNKSFCQTHFDAALRVPERIGRH